MSSFYDNPDFGNSTLGDPAGRTESPSDGTGEGWSFLGWESSGTERVDTTKSLQTGQWGATNPLIGSTRPKGNANPQIEHYAQLGRAVQQLQTVAQGQPQQMEQPPQDSSMGGGDPNASLTSGFDKNWLAEALAAGSANGAKIGGAGGGMKPGGGGGKKPEKKPEEPPPPEWDGGMD